MKHTTQQTILENAGIEIVSEEQTINSELETRINTRRKINRSIEKAQGSENYCGEVFDFPVRILEQMKDENDHFLAKLLQLKKDISPFKNVVPFHSDKYETGAILTDSWGWEQTNIDFYCIVKRSGNWITVLPMTKNTSEEKGFMTNEETPGEINFTADPIRKKINVYNGKESGFSFRNYSGGGYCSLWKGELETSTHYA